MNKTTEIIAAINKIPILVAWEEDGMIAVEFQGKSRQAVADDIEAVEGFPYDKVDYVTSDESVSIAWYRAKGGVTW